MWIRFSNFNLLSAFLFFYLKLSFQEHHKKTNHINRKQKPTYHFIDSCNFVYTTYINLTLTSHTWTLHFIYIGSFTDILHYCTQFLQIYFSSVYTTLHNRTQPRFLGIAIPPPHTSLIAAY